MKNIRYGVFETNSSSTHSLTVCMKSDYNKWENDELYFNDWWLNSMSEYRNQKFVTKEQALDIIEKSTYQSEKFEEFFYTCDDYFDDEYLETFEKFYTTPNGEEVVAFGKYGYEG